MRILLTISYDGTLFFGYQVQPNKRTVQLELENALKAVTGKDIKTVASGRTDSGVHALNQKVHFDYDGTSPVKNFVNALNSVLPEDIRVKKAQKVKSDFSARYSAKTKTYLYRIPLVKNSRIACEFMIFSEICDSHFSPYSRPKSYHNGAPA